MAQAKAKLRAAAVSIKHIGVRRAFNQWVSHARRLAAHRVVETSRQAMQDVANARSEASMAIAERDKAVAERDKAVADLAIAVQHRDAAQSENDKLLSTHSTSSRGGGRTATPIEAVEKKSQHRLQQLPMPNYTSYSGSSSWQRRKLLHPCS